MRGVCPSHLSAFPAAFCSHYNHVSHVGSGERWEEKEEFRNFLGVSKPRLSLLFPNICLSPLPGAMRRGMCVQYVSMPMFELCVYVTCLGSSERNRFISFHPRCQLCNNLPSKYKCPPSLCQAESEEGTQKFYNVQGSFCRRAEQRLCGMVSRWESLPVSF